MNTTSRQRWLMLLAALAFIVLAAWLGRARLERWTRSQLAWQKQRQLARLSEGGAARLTERLASADDEYLDIVVLELADPRPTVADAAQAALAERVEIWARWPAREASPRVAALAELLARSADRIPLTRRRFVQQLAERLLTWPVDGQSVDSPQLIANCELLLRLAAPKPEEVRLAVRSAPAEESADVLPLAEPAVPAPRPLSLSGHLPPAPPPEGPRVVHPEQPQALPDASRETPAEPRQFIAPRAIRITDEE